MGGYNSVYECIKEGFFLQALLVETHKNESDMLEVGVVLSILRNLLL